jgi:hypothetical protein
MPSARQALFLRRSDAGQRLSSRRTTRIGIVRRGTKLLEGAGAAKLSRMLIESRAAYPKSEFVVKG